MTVSRTRCAGVAVLLTAGLLGSVLVLARTASTPYGGSAALVRVCIAGLAVAAGLAWLQAMAGVADAWRGAPAAGGRGLRRLAWLACGLALAGGLDGPAHADTSHADTGPTPHSLAGLPFPDRAEGRAGRPAPPDRVVVVHAGDSLWSLAERELGERATDARVAARWPQIYQRNRRVIGPDPDLIHPGQVLTLAKEER